MTQPDEICLDYLRVFEKFLCYTRHDERVVRAWPRPGVYMTLLQDMAVRYVLFEEGSCAVNNTSPLGKLLHFRTVDDYSRG